MKFLYLLTFCFITSLSPLAIAQERVDNARFPPSYDSGFRVINAVDLTVDQQKTYKDTPTHPILRLTPDKSEIIRLDTPVSTVIVGNPMNLTVLPSTSKGLILVGKVPGATHFMALDSDNNIVMQRHVVVAAPKTDYVRVRKTCGGNKDCQATQVYYCPDACHETTLPDSKDVNTNTVQNDSGSINQSALAPLKDIPDE